jgi:hypothetical protein
MPPTDRTFTVEPWGSIRCGGPCRDDYGRIVAFQNRGGQILRLQSAARDSYLAAERRIGFAILVTGSLRSCEQQADLYRSDPQRFANPNTTGHTRGLCIDVSTNLSRWRQGRLRRALLARGWHQSRPVDEPWHYSFGIEV